MIVLFAYVKFTSDDRFDTMLVGGIHEVHGTKNVAVVRHGYGGHAELTYMFTEFFDVTSAIQKGIVGVQMQVDELGHGSNNSLTHVRRPNLWTAVRFRATERLAFTSANGHDYALQKQRVQAGVGQ